MTHNFKEGKEEKSATSRNVRAAVKTKQNQKMKGAKDS